MRAPVFIAASVIAAITSLHSPADAQTRVARPRAPIASRPIVVSSRPTVFVGGYYYPSLYRASLWYDPFYFGAGPGWGPGYYGYYGYGPAYYQFPVYGAARYDRGGSVRLQVSPREAEVFVDGYFAGTVDDFDGTFQRLNIEAGEHEIQVYMAGYRTFSTRFYLQPGKTFSIKQTLQPLGPGEPAPARPSGAPTAGPYFGSGPAPGPGNIDDEGRGGRGARGAGAGRGARGAGPGRGRQGGTADGFGSLSLRVQPADAEVLIDGEVWRGSGDNGPLVVQLGAGTHHIEIRKDGYRSYLTDLPFANGQARTLNVALTKQ